MQNYISTWYLRTVTIYPCEAVLSAHYPEKTGARAETLTAPKAFMCLLKGGQTSVFSNLLTIVNTKPVAFLLSLIYIVKRQINALTVSPQSTAVSSSLGTSVNHHGQPCTLAVVTHHSYSPHICLVCHSVEITAQRPQVTQHANQLSRNRYLNHFTKIH